MISCHRLIAKMPTLAAMAYKYTLGQPFVYPQNNLSYAENFLYMMFSVPAEPYKSIRSGRAMDKIFILHADHEQNASTSTVRLASSSGANPFACIAAGITSLWGPAHGGANEAVLKMLMEIGSKDKIPEIIKRAKDKTDSFRLMGFGHRSKRNTIRAPRSCSRPAAKFWPSSASRTIRYSIPRWSWSASPAGRLFHREEALPNVDFYSGIILRAMGFPMRMFTVLFALADGRLGRALAGMMARVRPRSAVHASFTPAPRSGISCRSTGGNRAVPKLTHILL